MGRYVDASRPTISFRSVSWLPNAGDSRGLRWWHHATVLPGGQVNFGKSKITNASKAMATVHGVVPTLSSSGRFVAASRAQIPGSSPCRSGFGHAGGMSPSVIATEIPVGQALPSPQLSTFSAAMKASCGMSTLPNCRIFFLPSFCFSRSLRLRVMSPP